jgi:uncharacterized protein
MHDGFDCQRKTNYRKPIKILEKLYPSEAEHYTQQRKAVEEGYQHDYDWLVEHLYEEMPDAQCKHILKILNMYRAITFSFKKLSDKSGLDESQIRFPGFDGNNEAKEFSYAKYLIFDLGKFQELRNGEKDLDLNSHRPILDQYSRMVELWKTYVNRNELNRQNLVDLLKT